MADNNELRVIVKAKELAKHTMILTSNCNRYPKKYRFSLVDKMQNKCLDIYTALFEANRTDIRDYKRDRLELQTKAITYCDELAYFIELSHELGIISSEKGQVRIAGSGISVLSDFTCIVKGLKTVLRESGISEDEVKNVLQETFDLALETEEPNEADEKITRPSMTDDVEKLLSDLWSFLREKGVK